jgi:hypothetical protein
VVGGFIAILFERSQQSLDPQPPKITLSKGRVSIGSCLFNGVDNIAGILEDKKGL